MTLNYIEVFFHLLELDLGGFWKKLKLYKHHGWNGIYHFSWVRAYFILIKQYGPYNMAHISKQVFKLMLTRRRPEKIGLDTSIWKQAWSSLIIDLNHKTGIHWLLRTKKVNYVQVRASLVKWIFYEPVRIYVYKAKESEVYATIDKLAVTSKTIFGSRGSTKRKVQKYYFIYNEKGFTDG